MTRPIKTLEQMVAEAANRRQRFEIAGKPADVCPYCGCAMIANGGTNKLDTRIIRYVTCRNHNCRRRFVSRQDKPTLVREVGSDDEVSNIGIVSLTAFRESA